MDDVCKREDLHWFPWLSYRLARRWSILWSQWLHSIYEQSEVDQMEGHLLEDLVKTYHSWVHSLWIPICRKWTFPLSLPFSKTEILVWVKQRSIPLLRGLSPPFFNPYRTEGMLCSNSHRENIRWNRQGLLVLAKTSGCGCWLVPKYRYSTSREPTRSPRCIYCWTQNQEIEIEREEETKQRK